MVLRYWGGMCSFPQRHGWGQSELLQTLLGLTQNLADLASEEGSSQAPHQHPRRPSVGVPNSTARAPGTAHLKASRVDDFIADGALHEHEVKLSFFLFHGVFLPGLATHQAHGSVGQHWLKSRRERSRVSRGQDPRGTGHRPGVSENWLQPCPSFIRSFSPISIRLLCACQILRAGRAPSKTSRNLCRPEPTLQRREADK